MEQHIVNHVQAHGRIENSRQFAQSVGASHDELVGAIKSLEQQKIVAADVVSQQSWALTDEGDLVIKEGGSPEYRVLKAVASAAGGSLNKAELQGKLGGDAARASEVEKIGYGQAMKLKWISQQKDAQDPSKQIAVAQVGVKNVQMPKDEVFEQLVAVKSSSASALDDASLQALKKRKLVQQATVKHFVVTKGVEFTVDLASTKRETDLTAEMLQDGSWQSAKFKQYNFAALGKKPSSGHLHPLLKVRSEFRKVFLEMGFEEMQTNNFVESSFWNFDALFQPQQHPARDAHDTFFLSSPATSDEFPSDYLDRVKAVHEKGGYGSIGYRYDWKKDETQKNLLRTHTTAVSSRYLYRLARELRDGKQPFRPRKFFSIDRVFRNEVPDATHLCEFHQIEGMVIDRNLSLGDMIGLFADFFKKIGITDLKFKPAYNPYTEPSMEIFGYQTQLKRWIEVGNSGMFRAEMLEPMGWPSDVTVLAWGLSLERPTMILYGIDNIRDLVGHKVPLASIAKNPIPYRLVASATGADQQQQAAAAEAIKK